MSKPKTSLVYSLPQQKDFSAFIPQVGGAEQFVFKPFVNPFPMIQLKGKSVPYTHETIFTSYPTPNPITVPSYTAYEKAFVTIQQAIHQQKIQKAIISHIHVKDIAGQNILTLIQQLKHKFPKALVYAFAHPQVGTWIGASPELLLSYQEGKAQTVALAGTKGELTTPWTEKEKAEQHIVLQAMETVLQQKEIPYQVSPLETISSGNLFHLKNTLTFPLNSMDLVAQVVDAIHPSPAIAGYPKTKSLEWIQQAESHERAYYCGYLGFSTTNSAMYFVNLRCGQIHKGQWYIYTGGGITKDSQLSKEWEECVKKAENLSNFI